ncbi:hypothetical protein GEMRC1_001412 [Eukaryota sp. GEM-RC1]
MNGRTTRKKIKELTVSNCIFAEESMVLLYDLIGINTSLTSIDFSKCGLVDDNLLRIISASQNHPSLKLINISSNDSGIKTILHIFKQFSDGNLISIIDISPDSIDFSLGILHYDNQLGDSDLISILNFLKSNVSIKRIDCLGFSTLSLQGLIDLFKICTINKTILNYGVCPHAIDVENSIFTFSPRRSTNISVDDVASLQCFLQSFSVKVLTLKNCCLPFETRVAIFKLLRINSTLTSIEFSDCDLYDDDLTELISSIGLNPSTNIRNIHLHSLSFSNQALSNLASTLRKNNPLAEVNIGVNSVTVRGVLELPESDGDSFSSTLRDGRKSCVLQ